MTFKSNLACATAAAAVLLAPAAALANTALQGLGTGSTFVSFDTDETVGWAFTANANLSVTKFGWFVTAPSLVSFHDVGMWDAAGNLLAQSTVLAPRVGDENGFTFVSTPFTAFTIQAGQTYYIGGRDLQNDGDGYITGLNFLSTDPAITFVGSARSAANAGFAFPSLVTTGARGRFGPNFKFDVVPDAPAGVPEPATWAMMIVGFGVSGALLRRRRQAPGLAG